MLKFHRNYRIEFEIGERRDLKDYVPHEIIEVAYPFTLQLSISSGVDFANVTNGNFQLYNLSPQIQAKLWKDNFDQTKYITMRLYAGYQDNLPLIFMGDILQCYSYRDEGSNDFVTDIQSGDGSYFYQYGFANITFTANTATENLLKTLLEDVPLYKLGYISPSIPPLKTNQTFIGQTMDLLGREYGNYQIFIDKGELNIINSGEVIPGYIPVITAESGLTGTPKRAQQYLNCEMIFEPQIQLGQAVELISDSLSWLNNIYKVIGVSHKGIISPRQSGKLKTSLQLYLGTAPFTELKKQISNTFGGEPTSGTWSKPVQGRITDSYGYRIHPIQKTKLFHSGLDIGTANNAPVYAPANGKVYFTGKKGEYGNVIQIDHGNINGKNVTSLYGHLNQYIVSNSQTVSKGQQIGLAGSTGSSTGPHLHFEIYENGRTVNPVKYIGNYG